MLYSLLSIETCIVLVGLLFSCTWCVAHSDEEELFRKKSTLLTKHISDQYSPPSKDIGDPEKYYWPKAMARFHTYGLNDDSASTWVRELSKNSPFHFTLVGMARLMHAYSNAPAVQAVRKRYLHLVFARRDNYNAWTCEGTENHISMSRTSGYLFAQSAVEIPELREQALKRQAQMKEWIMDWSKRAFALGTGEWNSGNYEVYNLIGWLNLFDYALDSEVRLAARAMVDYYATELALHYYNGWLSGAEMRGGPVGLPEGHAARYLTWLWFSPNASVNLSHASEHIQSIHAVLSAYRPPSTILNLARKTNGFTGLYMGYKPNYSIEKSAKHQQTLFLDSNFSLGSVQTTYSGYTGASSQIIPWKGLIRNGQVINAISGNGVYASYGNSGRDPYTQITQNNRVLIQLTKVPHNVDQLERMVDSTALDWQKLWRRDYMVRFPDTKSAKHKNVITRRKPYSLANKSFLSFPPHYKIIWTGNRGIIDALTCKIVLNCIGTKTSEQSVSVRSRKFKTRRNVVESSSLRGELCGWIVEIIPTNALLEGRSILKNNQTYVSNSGEIIELAYADTGDCTEPLVDWGYGQKQASPFVKSPPLQVPKWPRTAGFGRVVPINLTLAELNTVYSGPGLLLANGKLEVSDNQKVYWVDYTNQVPIFSEPSLSIGKE